MDEPVQTTPSGVEKLKTITKDTLIPLSAVLALFTSIMGYGELRGDVKRSKSDIKEIKLDRREDAASIHRIELRVVGLQYKAKIPEKEIAPVPAPRILPVPEEE